ncbi:CAP domain-containing protein [Sphingomonas sp. Tas61C01]|uniref:CAP domain-containing protein n=1 Tax=Sphingomonas sp. Tas61C01 TaxID=3458297 RepID=UPI00403ED828
MRADPAAYAEHLRDYRRYYKGNIVAAPGMKVRYLTEEGVAPVDEAVDYLERQGRRRPLAPAELLRAAAIDHCAEQAADGTLGHAGADGSDPGARVRRRGGGIYVGEVITYGSDNAADVVRQLIVDDGVADRGHRKLVFADDIDFAGVSCGPHPAFGTMCVVDVARTVDGRSRMQFAAN